MAMRQDIEFDAEGVTLRGWLYLPDRVAVPVPTVVMAHGFSAVKEMFLDSFADAFAAGGLGALVFDNRNFGASDGEPRQEIDPWAQVRDYRHAITWAQTRSEVDADRACQVPLVSGFRNIQRLVRQDFLDPTGPPWTRPRRPLPGRASGDGAVVDPDPLAVSALPTPDSWEWFSETGKGRAPAWSNEVTLRSVEMLMEYVPSAYLERISPTPLLMVVAAGDHLTPADLALEAYQRAREPKKLVLLPGGHFDAYVKDFETASGAARDWFLEHLGRSG